MLAALADAPGRLRGALRSRDTLLMAAALRAWARGRRGRQRLDGHARRRCTGRRAIDCGLAGTVMRFLPAVAALADGPVAFDGDAAARARPMGPVLAALRTLGVRVDEHGEPGHLPFTVHGRGGCAAARSTSTRPRPASSSPACCSPPRGSSRG